MKPKFWRIWLDGVFFRDYPQRAAARGAAIIFRAQGHDVRIEAIGY
jgi:predicted aminopeptidase